MNERTGEIARLRTADHEHPLDDKTIGVRQLHIDLGRMLANRGRIWTKCEKQKAAIVASGIMQVAVSSEDNQFAKDMLLYAFEEGDDQSPGKYLGEFRVNRLGDKDKQVELFSTTQMVSSLAKNVTDSKSSWVLYEMMPTDDHEVFANLPDDQKKWIEPDQKRWGANEYFKDGQPVDSNGAISQDPNAKKFERPLRDYLAIFRACEMYNTVYQNRVNSTANDLKYLNTANEEVHKQETLLEKEKTEVATAQKQAHKELDAVTQHFAALQRMLAFNQAAVTEAIKNNVLLMQDIARRQKEAADLIDRRTRSMAQYGPGAN